MSSSKTRRGQAPEQERSYHDERFQGKRSPSNRLEGWVLSLYPAMPSPIDKILGKLGQVSGKHICEIGCGRGRLTRELAARGAYVSASDISAEAVALTRKTTEDFIPKLVDVKEMDASNLLYDDNSFDLVVGLAILHHVDIDKASKDINRVLKRGGKAVFIEPLVHNPISNIWRMLTPGARTPHERPLAYSEIRKMGKQFSSVEYQEYALLTLLSSFVYLISHSHKAKRKSAELLARLEPAFLKIFKPLRRYCGAILIEFTK